MVERERPMACSRLRPSLAVMPFDLGNLELSGFVLGNLGHDKSTAVDVTTDAELLIR
jgi:hypothetical protein